MTRKAGYVRDDGIDKKIKGALKAGFGHQLLISHAGQNGLTNFELVTANRFGKGFVRSHIESSAGRMITLGTALSLRNKDLADMVIAGVASVRRRLDKQPADGWCTEAKIIVLIGFGTAPDRFTWFTRAVPSRQFGQQITDDEIDGYRFDAGRERPLGPARRRQQGHDIGESV